MRRFVVVAAACGLLAACSDSWLGDDAPAPLPGKRISVLAQSKSLEPDRDIKGDIILPPPEEIADWPQAGGFPNHAMHRATLGAHLKRVWTASVGTGASKRQAFFSEPVVDGGKVYAMDADSVVSSFDLKTGDRSWRLDLAPDDAGEGSFGGGLAYDGGKLYATTGFAQVVAIDPAKGSVLWRKSLPAPVRGAPTVRGGRILVVTVDNETLALSADDGRQLWHHHGISEVASLIGGTSPAIDGNTVLTAYTSGELYALRVENGTVQWSEVVSSIKRTDQVAELTDIRGLPVVDRGRVFVAGNSDTFAAIDLRTGRRAWEKDVSSTQTPWVAGDNVYLVTNAPELVCFDANTGRVRWVTPLAEWADKDAKSGRITWSGPVLASDRLIVASSEGKALSFSPYTGARIGEEELPDGVGVPPIVAHDTLIFITKSGDLVAYR